MPLVQRNCQFCSEPFERHLYPSRVKHKEQFGLFCSSSCAARARWAGRVTTGREMIRVDIDHPLAAGKVEKHGRPRILLYRVALWEKIGAGPHPCHWCKADVHWHVGGSGRGCHSGALVVDHLDGDMRNNNLSNLVPSCNVCNTLRSQILAWQEKTGLDIAAFAKT